MVGAEQPKVPIKFKPYAAESDPGPYPVPPNAPIEGGGKKGHGDKHVLVVQEGSCMLTTSSTKPSSKGEGWVAASGAVFNLRSDALRPEGWTSADAAGLPIFPLLARYPEVALGPDRPRAAGDRAEHAERLHPPGDALRVLDSSNPNLPPMGLRLRLKASYSLAGFSGESLVILEALKRYGLIVADNGSPWFITGAPEPRLERRKPRRDQAACRAPNSKPSKAARSCTAEPRRRPSVDATASVDAACAARCDGARRV